MIHFGLLLRKLREEENLSQTDCARKMGIPQSTLSNIERNPAPSIDVIIDYIKKVKPGMPLYRFFMSEQDVNDFMGIDPEWLEIGRVIQPYSVEIKNFFYDAEIPKDVLKSKMSDLEKEKQYLHKQLEKINLIRKDVLFEITEVIDYLREFPSIFQSADYSGKAEYLRAMSSRIIFTGDTVKVEWKKPFCWIVRVRSTMLAEGDDWRTGLIKIILEWAA